jgi:hypothetical protein
MLVLRSVFLGFALILCGLTAVTNSLDLPIFDRSAPRRHPSFLSCVAGRDDVVAVAGTLRNDGNGWYALVDEDHTPINIVAVESSRTGIRLELAFTAKHVITFMVLPDEVLAPAGYVFGASVGLATVDISLARTSLLGTWRRSPGSVTTMRYPWSNIWFYGLFRVPGYMCPTDITSIQAPTVDRFANQAVPNDREPQTVARPPRLPR